MAELVEPATTLFAQVLADPKLNARDRLRAAENICDRGGMPRRAELDVETSRETLIERLRKRRADLEAT